jgi:hypothetical protein
MTDHKIVDATLTFELEGGERSGSVLSVDCLLASMVFDELHLEFKDQMEKLPPRFFKRLSDELVRQGVVDYCQPFIAGEIYAAVGGVIEAVKKNSLLLSMSATSTESTDSN